jgi:hypothetical protein
MLPEEAADLPPGPGSGAKNAEDEELKMGQIWDSAT